MRRRKRAVFIIALAFLTSGLAKAADPNSPQPLRLWPGTAPGDKADIGPEHDTTKDPNSKNHDDIIRLGNVSEPTITVFKPAPDKDTGAAVVVCPGGAYNILAMNLEGTEVCDWLNSVGVTGVLLKYRVPARKGLEKHTAALQDAQRALGIVRHNAKDWKIDPHRVGIMGFSAGGHLSAAASNNFESRAYESVDDADKESCRPDFAILIYPAYLAPKEDTTKTSAELKVTRNTPTTFIAMTEDDPVGVEGAFTYMLALKKAKVPGEIHVFAKGGHGYGLRPSPNPISHWPTLAAEWLTHEGLLKKN